MSYINKLVAT